VDLLHEPKALAELDVELPKGVLLHGPAGTGKTLLAQAFADQAGLPIIVVSASDLLHPKPLPRPVLDERRMSTAAQLASTSDGQSVRYCDIVTLRQQPETANGTVLVPLEDETGGVQAIGWKRLRLQQSKELLGSRLLAVYGTWQREGDVKNLIAGRLENLTPLLGDWPRRRRVGISVSGVSHVA